MRVLRSAWLEPLLVVAATAAAYAGSLDGGFQFDDLGSIVSNPRVLDAALLWPPHGARWVGDVTFALNHLLGGLSVRGYHLVNVAIHVANALLVLRLAALALGAARARGGEPGPLVGGFLPLAAALLFALHPVATQAVTYLVQRYASLATLLYLAALVLYGEARLRLDAGGSGRAGAAVRYALAIACAVLAMRTKEIAFTLPLAAALLEVAFLGGPPRRRALLLPLFAAAVLVPLAHLGEGADLGAATFETEAISRSTYLLTETRVVATYLRLLVLPVGQNLDYDFPLSDSLADPRVLGATALLAAVAGGAVWLLLRSRRARDPAGLVVGFGALFFFLALSVESTVIPIRDVIYEHRVYLPLAGAALALAAALLRGLELARLPGSPALQVALALLVTAGPLGVATHARNEVWRDELTLWSDVVAKSPSKARPHNYLGIALAERGREDEALAEFRLALRLKPWYPDALLNLGNVYRARGQWEDAFRMYEKAVRVAPGMATAHNNLGGVYEARGSLEEAIREYQEAIRLAPGLPEARANLARTLPARARHLVP